ncbi:MAG: nitroreductase family protein [Oscillospiraceae bacterium]|nr:nitroreductase family protein [Oscillospiraceae bacterium]
MKNEALETLKGRRSIRCFKAEQITDAELNAVLEAGTYAPTAAGTQGAVIVAVQDPADVAQLDAMNAAVLGKEGLHPYYGAPTILLVFATEKAMVPETDCALVGGNLLNAAYAAGLGSCWIHRSKEMFASAAGKTLLKKWGLPDNLTAFCSIALGYADCPQPEAPARREGYIVRV